MMKQSRTKIPEGVTRVRNAATGELKLFETKQGERVKELEQELEQVHKWLDDRKVPRKMGDHEYSIIMRIQILFTCEVN